MIATRADHGAGRDLRLRSVHGPAWTSRFAVGATLALVAFLAGTPEEVSGRPGGAADGSPPHIVAVEVVSTAEVRSTGFATMAQSLASPAHLRRSQTGRRHWWSAPAGGCTSERHAMRSSSQGVLAAGVPSVRLSFLQFRATLRSAQTGLVSSWTTTTPPPASTQAHHTNHWHRRATGSPAHTLRLRGPVVGLHSVKRDRGAGVRTPVRAKVQHEEANVSRGVSPEDLMRFFDSELSESERWTVARQVSSSQHLQDELAFLEFVRSVFEDLRRTTRGLH